MLPSSKAPTTLRVALARLAIVVFVAFAVSPADAARFSRVVLDAGHGGHDRGGSTGRYYEKHFALDVAFRVEKYLKRYGMPVTMTRRRDQFIPLGTRCSISNRSGSAIFVSIHFNSASNKSAQGIETFYYSRSSFNLARFLQAYLIHDTKATNRGVKYKGFKVLRSNNKPSALVELGFMSNYSERRRFLNPTYRQKLAESIGRGILAYRKKG